MKHFSQNTLVDNKLKTYIMFVIFKTSNKDFSKTSKKYSGPKDKWNETLGQRLGYDNMF